MFYYDLLRELFEVANIRKSLITVRVSRAEAFFAFLKSKKNIMCHAKDMIKSLFLMLQLNDSEWLRKVTRVQQVFRHLREMGRPRGPDTGLPM